MQKWNGSEDEEDLNAHNSRNLMKKHPWRVDFTVVIWGQGQEGVSKRSSYRKRVRDRKKKSGRWRRGGAELFFRSVWKRSEVVVIECRWRIAIVLFPSCRRCLCVWMDLQWGSQDRERERERVISLGFCTAAARSGVGDILEPSIVYTDHKHLGSKAE